MRIGGRLRAAGKNGDPRHPSSQFISDLPAQPAIPDIQRKTDQRRLKSFDFVGTGGIFPAEVKIRPHDFNRYGLWNSRQVALQEGVGQRQRLGGWSGVNGNQGYAHDASPPSTGSSQTQGA